MDQQLSKERGYNLYDALIKRVDSEENIVERIAAIHGIMDEILNAHPHEATPPYDRSVTTTPASRAPASAATRELTSWTQKGILRVPQPGADRLHRRGLQARAAPSCADQSGQPGAVRLVASGVCLAELLVFSTKRIGIQIHLAQRSAQRELARMRSTACAAPRPQRLVPCGCRGRRAP